MKKVSFLEEEALKHMKEEEKLVSSGSKLVWDCNSCLYDSFELTSFRHHLESAIASSSRTNSMPHLSVSSFQPPAPAPAPAPAPSRNPKVTFLKPDRDSVISSSSPRPPMAQSRKSKALRSFSKLLNLFFRQGSTERRDGSSKKTLVKYHETSRRPDEAPLVLPELDGRVRKAFSERFNYNGAVSIS